ncbi:MAG: hypothetical protein JXR49_03095, partial [Acidobacteria bacterium]|nr:hypothetical protein [Acidobacteriota bacterium]
RSSNNTSDYTVEIEDSGPLRAQIKCSGVYESDTGDKRFRWIVRFNAYAGEPVVKVYHTVIFSEDMFKYTIPNISIQMPLSLSGPLQYAIGGSEARGIVSGSMQNNIYLLQDDWNHYAIKDSAGNVVDEGNAGGGNNADGQSAGWMDLSDGTKGVTVFIRDMWQTYPLELEADGNRLTAHLWPRHGDYTAQVQAKKSLALERKLNHFWPFHEGQELNLAAVSPGSHNYVETDPQSFFDIDYINNAAGIGKTHELIYYFHSGSYQTSHSENIVKQYREEILGTNPQWFCDSGAFRNLYPYDPERYPRIEKSFDLMYDSILSARNTQLDYGMIHYGDAHYSYTATGSGNRYWLHYRLDWPNFFWVMYLRTGDPRYLREGIASSRHLMDVDTVQVESVFTDCLGNIVNRFIGGYPSGSASEMGAGHWKNEPREPGIDYGQENFFNYYYLTGYKRAKEVIELAGQNVINKNPILPDGTISYWGTRDVHALTLYVKLYQLGWDERYLALADAGFKTIKDKLQLPNGILADTQQISYSLLFSGWVADGLDNYRFVRNTEEIKDVLLRFAKAIGGMGKYDDALGLRLFGSSYNVFDYGFALSEDSDFMSYGKYQTDLYSFKSHKSTTTPQVTDYAWPIRLTYFLKALKNYGSEIPYPEYPPMFINIKENSGVRYLIKEDTDRDIQLLFAIEVDTNDYGWQESGNIGTKIYDPDNRLVYDENYKMPNKYDFQLGDTVEADPRLKYFTIPADGKTGEYRIEFSADKDRHMVALISNNLDKTLLSVSPEGVFLGRGRYFFYVPDSVSEFSITSPSPYWHPFTIIDPYGNPQTGATITPSSMQKNKLWSVVSNRAEAATGIIYLKFSGLSSPMQLSLSPQTHFNYTPSSYLQGDVNMDTFLNIQDLQALVNHILGLKIFGSSADIDGNNLVNTSDLQLLINILLGLN